LFTVESIKSLAIASVLLIVGLIFLPESWIIRITKVIKPAILDAIKQPFRKLINALASLYVTNSFVDISEQYPEFNQRSEFYLKENKKIEKNIYVIDLCKDMIATLNFALPKSTGRTSYYIYEESMNYLYHYSRIAENLEQDKNFISNYLDKIEELRKMYTDMNGLDSDPSVEKIIVEHCVSNVLSYMGTSKNSERKML